MQLCTDSKVHSGKLEKYTFKEQLLNSHQSHREMCKKYQCSYILYATGVSPCQKLGLRQQDPGCLPEITQAAFAGLDTTCELLVLNYPTQPS